MPLGMVFGCLASGCWGVAIRSIGLRPMRLFRATPHRTETDATGFLLTKSAISAILLRLLTAHAWVGAAKRAPFGFEASGDEEHAVWCSAPSWLLRWLWSSTARGSLAASWMAARKPPKFSPSPWSPAYA